MSSPFKIFRRHEKLLMVVATGLAMISFVFLGALGDGQAQLPPTLIVLLVASLLGTLGWLIGLQAQKASEWGISGVIIGALLGLLITVYTKEANAVAIGNGGMTASEVSELRSDRIIANRFLQGAYMESGNPNPRGAGPYMFGFFSKTDVSVEDVVLGELLRREADELGVVITDEAALDLIKKASNNKMTKEAFKKIRESIAVGGGKVTERKLLDALKSEMKANEARKLLYTQNQLTLENYWDFYKKVSVRQAAEVAAVPVSAFIDESAEPVEAELAALFQANRTNMPNFNEKGRPDEGRPGFLQPRRIQIGYLEAVYEDIEPLVGEVTDEEIQKEYEERYLRQMPAQPPASNEDLLNSGPLLPNMKLPVEGDGTKEVEDAKKPETEKTEEPKKDETKPAETSKKPAENEKPAVDDKKPAEEPKTEAPQAEKPTDEAPKEETPKEEAPATEKPEVSTEKPAAETPEPKATEEASTSAVMKSPNLQTVAFFQDEEAKEADAPKEAPATEEKPVAEEKPADEKTATEKTEAPKEDAKPEAEKKPAPAKKPADDKSAEEKPKDEKNADDSKKAEAKKKPKGDEPAKEATGTDEKMPAKTDEAGGDDVVPPAPEDEVRKLDDDLKMELRDDILRRKTQEEIQKRVEAAYDHLSTLSYNITLEEDAENYITLEEATKQLNEYAEKNGLVYIETPLLSQQEMRESEDYPIGLAVTALGNRQLVSADLFASSPEVLYTVNRADRFTTDSAFAFWKIGDKQMYAPETMEEEGVREQVIEAWKLQQALPKAQERAEELAKLARESEADDLTKVFNEVTLSGEEGGLFVEVRETGDFSWMQRSSAAPTGLGQEQPARQSVIPGVEDAGERFFGTVFNELNQGDVGVAPNRDSSVLYVTRIDSRYPSSDAELATLRENFLRDMQTRQRTKQLLRSLYGQDMPDTYTLMEYQEQMEHSVDWVEQLFDKYNVDMGQEAA